jgi:predicted outer membrane repeat protein
MEDILNREPGAHSGLESTSHRVALAVVCLTLVAALLMPASGLAGITASVPCGGGQGGAKGLIATIQKANAQGGGTIELARGCTYSLSKGPFSNGTGPDGLPPISSPIKVMGQNSSIVRKSGSPQFRLFELKDSSSASLTITGVALRNGSASAILVGVHGGLVARRATFSSNSADLGGGAIYSQGGPVKIVNSKFRANQATDGSTGGAIIAFGPLRIDSSIVIDNEASAGGGGISPQSAGAQKNLFKMTDSTVSGNTTGLNGGGGIFIYGPERVVISRSTIANNTYTGSGPVEIGDGAGIFNTGQMTITDSTITGNVAGGKGTTNDEGGGIYNTPQAGGAVSASTIVGNGAVGAGASGGGIANAGSFKVKGSIVAGNRNGNCLGDPKDGGFNLEDGHSCGFAKHAVKGNPLLASLADNGGPTETMALKPKSPAINRVRAKSAACKGTADQRGVPRPQASRCDIGAFEVVKTKTSLAIRRRGEAGRRAKLKATVKPKVAIPGQPKGKVIFRDGRRVLGKEKLNGKKPDTASLKVRLGSGNHRLKASYKGSKLFLPSSGAHG